ncbi:hypothetical protein WJX82_002703 [Trebouxia sp. C0006]
MGRNSQELTYALLREGPPTINVNATTPGSATEAVSREVLSAWQMRTNYIEYHLRLQNQRPKQGKLFAEEYPEPSTPPALQEPSEPSEEYSFGSSQDGDLPSTSGTQATTVAQTMFNVANLFIGLGLLSTAYALKLGGWMALLGLAANAACFATAGLMQIRCLDSLPSHLPRTYHDVGQFACGQTGRVLVSAVTTLEYFGYACMQLILLWHQLEAVLPSRTLFGAHHHYVVLVIALVAVCPILLIGNFRHVSILSVLGISCTSVLLVSVCGAVAEDPSRHRLPQPPPPHIWLGASLPQAMGIFAVALSGPSGSALPTLRATMQQPLHFKRVLLIALGVMTGVYALMGILGYFYFGSEASQLITADLETKSVLSHVKIFGLIRFDKVVSGLIGVHAFTVLGPQILVLQKMLAAVCPKEVADDGSVEEMSQAKAISLRFGILAVVVLVAALSFEFLGNVESIVGAVCSMSSSMLLPAFFFLRIHKEELQKPRQYAVIIFMLVGAILAATIVHNNVMAFSHARHLKPAANLWMSGNDLNSAHLAHYRRLMLV